MYLRAIIGSFTKLFHKLFQVVSITSIIPMCVQFLVSEYGINNILQCISNKTVFPLCFQGSLRILLLSCDGIGTQKTLDLKFHRR
jgi:hypothetical protein